MAGALPRKPRRRGERLKEATQLVTEHVIAGLLHVTNLSYEKRVYRALNYLVRLARKGAE